MSAIFQVDTRARNGIWSSAESALMELNTQLGIAGAPIANARASQRAGTKLVDVYYDLSGTNGPYSVRLECSDNGGATYTLPVTSLSGDFGSSVAAGSNKRVVWNAGADWNNQFSDTIRFRVVASKRGLTPKSADSGLTRVDTLRTLPANLYLDGPLTLASGGSASYRVMWQPSDGLIVDVTTKCTLGFVGPTPTGTGIGGWTVFAGRVSEASSFQLRGRYTSGAGQVFSAPLTVTIQPTLLLTLKASLSGTPGNTSLTLQSTASGGRAPIAITWDTDDDGAYDDASGASATIPFNRPSRTYLIRGRGQDTNGLVKTDTVSVTINAPPVPNEPPVTKPKPDPQIGIGTLKDAEGKTFVLDPIKASNGLVIITHGLDFQNTNDLSWMRNMAVNIRERCLREGELVPQIMLYEWPSNLSASDNIDERAQAILDRTEWPAAFPLLREDGSPQATLAAAVLKKILAELSGHSFGPVATVSDFAQAVAKIWPFAYDILAIRQRAEHYGRNLAGYITAQTVSGHIDPHAPIHFIGHSAGGFVVTTAAENLKQWFGINGNSFASNAKFLVTTLDTPFLQAAPFISFPNPGRIERYISQFGGLVAGFSFAPQLERAIWAWEDFDFWDGSTWYPNAKPQYRNPPGSPGRYYQRVELPFANTSSVFDGHTFAHTWYAATVLANGAGSGPQGFSFSPLLGNRPFAGFEVAAAGLAPLRSVRDKRDAADFPPDDVCLTMPTGVFGSAVADSDGLTLTENGNAGAYFDVAVPEFARALGFSYHFPQSGDGDFLSVEIEGADRMASGLDTSLSQAQFMNDAFDVSPFAGRPIRLIFRLVSRGETNALLKIQDICFKITEDADGDGVLNNEELIAGTDPYSPDSDFDGISDFDELKVSRTDPLSEDTDGDGQSDWSEIRAGTNPLDTRSRFHIQRAEKSPLNGPVTLTWSTVPGRFYRVIRSESLEREEYEVASLELQATSQTLTFTEEPAAFPGGVHFYWVECLQEP